MSKVRMKKQKLFFVVLVILIGLWGIRAFNNHRYHLEKETRFMMDTYATILAVGPEKTTAPAIDAAMDRLQEIDVKFNSLNPKSPIYAFNHSGKPISDPEILELIRLALQVSKDSDGAFDITVAPLVELWGFYEKSYRLPEKQKIKNTLRNVGYKHLYIRNGKLEKDKPGVRIDLGGIAKGYALAEAVKVLKLKGVKSALIDLGGDVFALGKKGKNLWKIGIKDPRQEGILGYVEVEDLAVESSGDYERGFNKNGKRYHHIFNPKTGYPTEGVSSVTLIYKDPVLTQPWTKIPFVLGAKRGLELLERISGMEAIIITASGEILYSSGLKHVLKKISGQNIRND